MFHILSGVHRRLRSKIQISSLINAFSIYLQSKTRLVLYAPSRVSESFLREIETGSLYGHVSRTEIIIICDRVKSHQNRTSAFLYFERA